MSCAVRVRADKISSHDLVAVTAAPAASGSVIDLTLSVDGIALLLEMADRIGDPAGPEGSCWIQISDQLARRMAATLRRLPAERRFRYRALVRWGWCLTTVHQGSGAPWRDRCWVTDDQGRSFEGWCILLQPWRVTERGEYERQRALVFARQRRE